MRQDTISIVLPAKNEAASLKLLLPQIKQIFHSAEILVINDGSSDETAKVAAEEGARVISHPYSQGNGAAIKTGARHAAGDLLVFMDSDGQHNPEDIPALLDL
ncbi:MAG: glycosyltransferase family 2 protein, partial [Methylosarcina sp.]